MKERTKEFQINGILVLVLFGVFAVSILAVLLTGAGAYKRLTERGQATYTTRTVPQYVSTRVRQADGKGNVTVGMFEGVEALELAEEIDGKRYVTRIYCYDGYVRELFSEGSVLLRPSDGECIMEADEMHFSMQKGFLSVDIRTKDENIEINLALRSKEVSYEE